MGKDDDDEGAKDNFESWTSPAAVGRSAGTMAGGGGGDGGGKSGVRVSNLGMTWVGERSSLDDLLFLFVSFLDFVNGDETESLERNNSSALGMFKASNASWHLVR